MTNKIKILSILLIISAILLNSCGDGSSSRLTSDEVAAYEGYVLSSYFLLRGDAALPESRAAWDYTQAVDFPADGAATTATSDNYPEKGQSTAVTITRDGSWAADVYKVVNVTTYPGNDSIDHTTESYYIKDDGDGEYNTADSICTEDGTPNPLAREEFVTVYDNELERNEKVIATKDSDSGEYGTVNYADFDIKDSFDFPNSEKSSTLAGGTLVDDVWSPKADVSAQWSSMTAYNQEITYKFRSWSYTYRIIGVRYYTENLDDLRTSVTYERGIATPSEDEDLSSYTKWKNDLFKGRNKKTAAQGDTVYIETVIRTSANGAGNKKVKTSSNLYDETGASAVTFTANYEEDENGAVTSSGAPVANY